MAHRFDSFNGRVTVSTTHSAYSPGALNPPKSVNSPKIMYGLKGNTSPPPKGGLPTNYQRVLRAQSFFLRPGHTAVHVSGRPVDKIIFLTVMSICAVGVGFGQFFLGRMALPKNN